MSTLTIPNTFTNLTEIIDANQVNANFTAVATVVNGQLDNTNITAAANIALSKLALAPGANAFNKTTTGNYTWASGLSTDTNPQVQMTSDAGLQFGPGGNTAVDVQLKRSAANTLQLAKAGGGTGAVLDMNSGSIINFTLGSTVNVAGGGTGLTTVTANSIPYGAGTSPLSLLASVNNGAMYFNNSGVPSAGTLPAASGGTGVTLFTHGQATFATAQTVTVTDATITASSLIFVQETGSGTPDNYTVSVSAGVGFTIKSSNATSTKTVNYLRLL